MKIHAFIFVGLITTFLLMKCSKPRAHFEIVDGYMYIQKEERRNDSTEKELVWEDEFDKSVLDTCYWTKIGRYTSDN